MTAKWTKDSKVTGYEILYSTSSKFTSSTTKKATVTSYKTVQKILSGTKNKRYYVKIRAYKTYGGIKYYSAYSSVRNVKVKR